MRILFGSGQAGVVEILQLYSDQLMAHTPLGLTL